MSDAPTLTIGEADAQLTAPGQMFEMQERVIRGIATRTWKNAPSSLRAVLELSVAHGDATFLVYEDERTTFAEHYRIACTLAVRLRDRFAVAKGDRVAIVMRNLPEWVMAFWAATLTGAIVVPLNAWWTGEELSYGLEDSGSKVAFVDSQRAEQLRPFLRELPHLTALIVTDEHRVTHELAERDRRAPRCRRTRHRACTVGRSGAGLRMAFCPGARGGRRPRLATRRLPRPGGRRHHLLHLGDHGAAQGGRRHPSQHLHQPDEPLLHQHQG